MKILKSDLDEIRNLAINYYVNNNLDNLDSQQFNSQCWLKAVIVFLKLDINLELPNRQSCESIDDQNT